MTVIAVLHTTAKPTWTTWRLLNAIKEYGVKPLYITPDRITVEIGRTDCVFKYLGKCVDVDAIIVRSIGVFLRLEQFIRRLAMLKHIEEQGVFVINPSDSLVLARDKYTSLRILSRSGIPVPETKLTEDAEEALRTVSEWGSVVIKPIMGSRGIGSIKIDDPDLAYYIISYLMTYGYPLYMQKYIEKKGNRDIRVFVVGEKIVASMYRVSRSPNKWKTNVSQGAIPEPAEINDEIADIAIKATKVLGLHYGGVDIAETLGYKHRYVVFEVNAMPSWKGLYQATGIDPAKYIVEYILDNLRK